MSNFQQLHNEFMLLVGHSSPLTHRLAADRILSMSECAKTTEDRKRVFQATVVWTGTLSVLMRHTEQVSRETLPLVVMAKKDMEDELDDGDCECVPPDPPGPTTTLTLPKDGFLDDFPFPFEKKLAAPAPKVKPSPVIQPGPLEPLQRVLHVLDDEDELRTWCVYGPQMGKDGSIPSAPLVDGPTIKSHNNFIARMYRQRKIERPWAMPAKWDVDTAMVEDVILLLILVHGDCSVVRINWHIQRLRPFVRRLDEYKLRLAGYRAVRKLEKMRIIAKCKPSTYEFRVGWDQKLQPLLAAWEGAGKLPQEVKFPPKPDGGPA